MGLAGAGLVTVWAVGLARRSGTVLLDAEMDSPVVAEVREVLERVDIPARISDLHVWPVGRGKYAVAADVVSADPVDGNYFRRGHPTQPDRYADRASDCRLVREPFTSRGGAARTVNYLRCKSSAAAQVTAPASGLHGRGTDTAIGIRDR